MQVLPVPGYYLRKHHSLIQEFQNSTHWPKHLLVRYHWTHSNALNINAALYTLFGVGEFAHVNNVLKFLQAVQLHAHLHHAHLDDVCCALGLRIGVVAMHVLLCPDFTCQCLNA